MGSRVGLLTGTFDPIHLGHVALAKAAVAACDLQEVWVLVNPNPEHKTGVLPYAERLAMAQLAVQDEGNIRMVAEPVVHTMVGFAEFMATYLGYEFVFIVGMDTMARLDEWEAYPEVVRRAAFAVAQRRSVEEAVLDDLRRRLGLSGLELKAQVFGFGDYALASSMVVRNSMRVGARSEWLDPRVYEYILAQGLYRLPSHSA